MFRTVNRHVARLRRLGLDEILRGGGNIVTGKHTQLTVAITSATAVLRVEHKTMLRKKAENVLVSSPTCDILRYVSRK